MVLSKIKEALPIILSLTSVVGLAATTALAITATPKATELLKTEEAKKGEKLTKKEVVKTVWRVYIPTSVAFVGTASCIIGTAILNRKQQASLVSAYALVSSSYNKYKDKVKQLFGEEAHRNIISEIAAEKAKNNYISAVSMWQNTTLEFGDDEEEVTFYDTFSDRYFTSTVNKVLQAEYHLNRNYFLNCCSQTLNDFYALLGIEPTDFGEKVGWFLDDYSETYWIDFDHYKTVQEGGLEVHVIEMVTAPTTAYSEGCDEWNCITTDDAKE